jgi:hypothetical protein
MLGGMIDVSSLPVSHELVRRLRANLRRATHRRDPSYWRPETRAEAQYPVYYPWTSGMLRIRRQQRASTT